MRPTQTSFLLSRKSTAIRVRVKGNGASKWMRRANCTWRPMAELLLLIHSSAIATSIIGHENTGIPSGTMACHWQLLLRIICSRNVRRERSVPSGKFTRRKLWTSTLSETSCRHKGWNTRQSTDDILAIKRWEFTPSWVWRIGRKFFEEEDIRPQKKVGQPSTASIRSLASSTKDSVVTPEQFRSAKQHRAESRLCGDFGHNLSTHLKSIYEPAAKIKCGWQGFHTLTRFPFVGNGGDELVHHLKEIGNLRLNT